MSNKRVAFTAVIPLRAGSKGLPGKNIRPLCGEPLYLWTVGTAREAGASRVVITTDIDDLPDPGALASRPPVLEIVRRPPALCTDQTPMAPVLAHAIHALNISGPVALLQATSPLRIAADIEEALALHHTGAYDLVMSVTEADRSVLKWGRLDGNRYLPISGDPANCFANRQSLPAVYRPNGAVYIIDAHCFATRGDFASNRIGVIRMPAERSHDIDDLADFEQCEAVLRRRLPRTALPRKPVV